MESSEFWIMRDGGGWTKFSISGWVRHIGGGVARSKNGGGGSNPFQINFGATKDT